MNAFSPELFISLMALIGAVIAVSALLSGLVDKSGVPQVAVFLAMGAAIGPSGLGLLDAGVESGLLRVVATLSLVLVLFTDAVSLDIAEVRRHRVLASLVLGPGTAATAVVIALAAWKLLGFSPALAAILGAALASTDPVLLRGLLRKPNLPGAARQALRLESGMNDAVLLPVVIVAMEILAGGAEVQWGKLALNMLVLSPGMGLLIGGLAVAAVEFARKKIGVRRDYESIYSLGIAFAAYAAAESIHGSGFLAAFFAGLAIAALDVELCDCFLEYGETTAEMALLFTFVLLGASVIWSGLGVVSLVSLAFVAIVFGARLVSFPLALLPARIESRQRWLIAWFGPRGLSSLLLVLVPVFAGTPGALSLLPICCLVVLCSVVIHGLTPGLFLKDGAELAAAGPESPVSPVEAHPQAAGPACTLDGACELDQAPLLSDPEYVTLGEAAALGQAGEQVIVVDARSERTYNESDQNIPEAIRLHPDRAVFEAGKGGLPKTAVLAVLCA